MTDRADRLGWGPVRDARVLQSLGGFRVATEMFKPWDIGSSFSPS